MKTEKRLLALFLCIACIILCACGTAPENSSPTEAPVKPAMINETEPVPEPIPEVTPEPSQEPTPEFEPVVIFNNDDITFTITGVNPEVKFDYGDMSWISYEVKVFCENKTDKNVLFSFRECSVNDFMIDSFWGIDVAAGKKANGEFYFSWDELHENGIEQIEKIEAVLAVSPEISPDNYDGSNPVLLESFVFEP